jgi:cysteinyl-tRNA synthetase
MAMRVAMEAAASARGPGTRGTVPALLASTKARFLAAMDDDVNTPDAVYRLQQMTEALRELPNISREEGRDVVALYSELGGILGLFSEPGDAGST